MSSGSRLSLEIFYTFFQQPTIHPSIQQLVPIEAPSCDSYSNAIYYVHRIQLYKIFYASYYMHCILCIVFSRLCSMHCILCIVFYALNELWNSLVTNRQTDRRTLSRIELLSQLKMLQLELDLVFKNIGRLVSYNAAIWWMIINGTIRKFNFYIK